MFGIGRLTVQVAGVQIVPPPDYIVGYSPVVSRHDKT